MGIRFRCPNGHKLHVKSFLAGKRGICPECGIKVEIPQESQADDESQPASATSGTTERGGTARPNADRPLLELRTPSPSLPKSATLPKLDVGPKAPPVEKPMVATPSRESSGISLQLSGSIEPPKSAGSGDSAIRERWAGQGGRATGGSRTQTPVQPPLPPPGAPAALTGAEADPFRQSLQAVWYVRPPQGGQYGPASSLVMKGWVEEGRVPPESLIWAEGWPEWRSANSVIPSAMLEEAGKRLQGPVPKLEATPAPAGSLAMAHRRRQSRKWSVTVVAMLCVLCAILFVALIYVIKFMN